MFARILASLIVVGLWTVVKIFFRPAATIVSADTAAGQFKDTDASALAIHAVSGAFSGLDAVLTLVALGALVWIWRRPLQRLIGRRTTFSLAGLALACAALAGHSDRALAFAETVDKTEAYTILPNESAFFIPDVGANKEAQAQFDSEAYLQSNKIAVKRFIIPHQKLSGSGGTSWLSTGWDFYVPTGRLIIVDRTPYSREWVAAHDRGTSAKNESIPCQSKEGVNISVGVSIGASVTEENAAKYLYHFGVLPPMDAAGRLLDRASPQTIFTSVYYSRRLSDVMDDVGRKRVQTLVCNEIAARSFDEDNDQAVKIMDNVKKSASDYFAGVGITLDFIGWGDTFTFDPDVQKAVNDKRNAEALKDVLPVLQALAQLKVQEGMGAGMASKGLPIVVTPGMLEALARIAAQGAAAAAQKPSP
jgi:hypothetical protein